MILQLNITYWLVKKIIYRLTTIGLKLFLITLVFFTISCSENNRKENKATIEYDAKYSLEVVDTLRVKYNGRRLIQPVDYNRKTKNILLASEMEKLDTILQVDRSGNIVNTFFFKGNSEDQVGNVIHNFGYYRDTCIVINSERGFFFYDLNGSYLKSIMENTPIKSTGGFGKRIREFGENENTVVALQLKSTLPNYIGSDFSKKILNQYKYLTFYNLEEQTYTENFGYENETVFKKKNVHFGNPSSFFDYNDEFGTFHIIHNPDPKMYIYQQDDNFRIPSIVKLNPEHLALPIKFSANELSDRYRHLILNGHYTDINCSNNFTLITYNTGIPEDEFAKIRSSKELPDLYNKLMKYYTIIVDDTTKVSKDIELPVGATGVGVFESVDYILLKSNHNVARISDSVMFYVCKLVKNEV